MQCEFQFHGVGQGLFYTANLIENKINVAKFIYDCGSDNTKHLSNAINDYHREQSTSLGEFEIDFLAISHLDRDHINGLPQLLKFVKPKKIYLPYFDAKTYTDVFKAYLICADISTHSDVYSLLMSWYTNPNENVEFIKEPVQAIRISGWKFLFFNLQIDSFKYVLLQNQIQALLLSNGVSSIDEYVKANANLKDLKKIFLSVFGKSHQNSTSLLLLHYASNNAGTKTLLTGDVPFNNHLETRVLKYLSERTDLVLQVPHHGARKEWDKLPSTIKSISSNMVISFGLGNKHRHPSKNCINDIVFKYLKSKLNCVFQSQSYSNKIS